MDALAFVINTADNVATALTDLPRGTVTLKGATERTSVQIDQPVRSGHKIALHDLKEGEAVIKYGSVIGKASEEIAAGSWTHLHNVASQFDERSGTLDGESGAPTEGDVYV